MRLRLAFNLFVVSLAFLAALVVHRVAVMDLFRSAAQPELPEAVTFEQVKEVELEEPEEIGELPVDQEPEPSPMPDVSSVPQAPQAPQAPQSLPSSFNLAVPFTTQAPFANWDEVHEETCEEASLLMVDAYYDGRTSLLPEWVEEELLAIVDFEMAAFGYFEDTTAAETALVAEKRFGYASARLLESPTVEDLKRVLFSGHPIILPVAGRELHNPYFKQPGPDYHMLVIRGWTEEGFITNDPGTRHGGGYVYSYETVMDAMHDWNPADVHAGAKVVLVLKPNE